jgi:hypothetical protein
MNIFLKNVGQEDKNMSFLGVGTSGKGREGKQGG